MSWINKIKQLLLGFLSTHDGKYIVTDQGKKLVAFDYTFRNAILKATSFNKGSKSSTNYSNKTKA